MTIIFSIVCPDLIVMAVDSAVTLTFNDGEFTEYDTGQKAYDFPGVGVVATWGNRTGNNIGIHLNQLNISADSWSVYELVKSVKTYLQDEYRPHERESDDVGFHIAGFTKGHQPRLYHVLYGFDRPKPEDQTERGYKIVEHHEPGSLVYNGRNDIAERIIYTLLDQIKAANSTRFNKLNTPEDIIRFSDFVIRFAAEITPEVDKPFNFFLITSDNHVGKLQNEEFKPLDIQEIQGKLEELGY